MEDFLTLVLFSGTEKQDLLGNFMFRNSRRKLLGEDPSSSWEAWEVTRELTSFLLHHIIRPNALHSSKKKCWLIIVTWLLLKPMELIWIFFYNVHNHNHKHHPFMSPSHDNCPPLRHLPVAEIHAVLGRLHVGCKHDTLPASWHPIQPTSRGFWWKV